MFAPGINNIFLGATDIRRRYWIATVSTRSVLPYFFPLRPLSRASVPRPRRIRLHGASGSMANECRPQVDSRVLRPAPGSEQVFSTLSVSARYLTAWVAHDSHDRRRSQYGPAELGVGCGLSAAPPSTGHGRGIHRHLRGQTSAALHPK